MLDLISFIKGINFVIFDAKEGNDFVFISHGNDFFDLLLGGICKYLEFLVQHDLMGYFKARL